MSLTPDWAPNIHPIVVHFPIALLSAAVLVDFLGLFMRKSAAIRDTATWLYCAGAGVAILAYFTGSNGADAMRLPAQVSPLVTEHSDWAFRTTWFFAFFASARLAVSYILPPKPIVLASAFALAVGGLVMLVETAQHGAILVFQHGLGVQAITTDEPLAEPAEAAGPDQIERFLPRDATGAQDPERQPDCGTTTRSHTSSGAGRLQRPSSRFPN